MEEIKLAMRTPDKKENAYENKVKVQKVIGGKTLEVVYCKEGFRDKKDEYLLITAYYI